MEKVRCETCAFFYRGSHKSECRRNPPPWQLVTAEDFCGEWQDKETWFKERIKGDAKVMEGVSGNYIYEHYMDRVQRPPDDRGAGGDGEDRE